MADTQYEWWTPPKDWVVEDDEKFVPQDTVDFHEAALIQFFMTSGDPIFDALYSGLHGVYEHNPD